ncbi:MAG: hypothetical protein K1Y02_05705 [Candidatus Hydrogenedentes bacterium]|nr:hypothetical protein [Candidatus Hydrogenedentota bacterium]
MRECGSRLLWLGIAAVALCGTAWAVPIGYTDCEGYTVIFDSDNPPAWAVQPLVPSHRAKFNQITFNVTYLDVTNNNNIGFDDPALGTARRDVVDRVLEYLGDVLNESSPATCDIVFNVSETDGTSFLASAGPYFSVSPNGFSSGFAHQHITTGVDPSGSVADVTCTVDFGWPWYTAAATTVPGGQYDLFSVLLHEMTHGLGILSLSNASGTSKISGGNPGVYSKWDDYMETGTSGTVIFNNTTTVFVGNTSYLTGSNGGLVLDCPFGNAAYGGTRPPLYAPSPFVSGSSLSHWSDGIGSAYVMKRSIASGVAIRTYAPVEVAVLKDIGYVNAEAPTAPDVDFASATYTIAEGNSTASLTVSLSEAPGPGNTTTVDYAITGGSAEAGKDYTLTSGTVQFNAFDSSKTVNIQILDDAFREPNETVVVTLSNPVYGVLTGTNNPATLTIQDTDPLPGVDFSSATYSIGESGLAATLELRLTDAPGTGNTAVVTYTTSPGTATSGVDYPAVSNTVTFGAAETVKTFNVPITNDTKHESNETFTVTLSNPSSAILLNVLNPATVTITDDDPDTDADGISDADELSGLFGYVTNPNRTDTDYDTIPDWVEIQGLNGHLTDPTDADSDNDGAPDGVEVYFGTDPLDPFDTAAFPTISVPRFEER